ncbi:hypothetical protein HYS10_00315 [Candidatus Collierbacteria bacterium]|nr:hypothetical protein [Candidatus Collierbacteria bacterium]
MKAFVKKSQTHWRYDQYLKDSQNCPECQALWAKLKEEDATDLEQLKKAVIKHVKSMEGM